MKYDSGCGEANGDMLGRHGPRPTGERAGKPEVVKARNAKN
jgi:hypothetical protein